MQENNGINKKQKNVDDALKEKSRPKRKWINKVIIDMKNA